MSVIRIKKARQKPYVILDTTALNDKRLSFRAKGLHTYLMAKPDDWHIHIEQLEKESPREARDAIRTALKELEDAGYLRRRRIRGQRGRMMGWDTTVYETPQLAKLAAEDEILEHSAIGLSGDDPPKADYPNSDEPTSDKPTSDRPTSVQPSSDNPTLLINDVTQYGVVPSIEETTPPVETNVSTSPTISPRRATQQRSKARVEAIIAASPALQEAVKDPTSRAPSTPLTPPAPTPDPVIPMATAPNVDAVIQAWNDLAKELGLPPKTDKGARNKKLRHQICLRLKENPEPDFLATIWGKIRESAFLQGSTGWVLTLDWLFENDHNIIKVYEGQYKRDRASPNQRSPDAERQRKAKIMRDAGCTPEEIAAQLGELP